MKFENQVTCSGEAQVTVRNPDGEVVLQTPWKKNLINTRAIDVNGFEFAGINTSTGCYESNDVLNPVENKRALTGTYSVTGNVLTVSGGPDFTDQGEFSLEDTIVLSGGERMVLSGFATNSTTWNIVKVTDFDDVSGLTATQYRTGASSNNASQRSESSRLFVTLNQNLSNTYNASGVRVCSAEGTSSQQSTNYQFDLLYIGASNPYSRIVLDDPIQVVAGNTVTVAYRVTTTFTGATVRNITPDPAKTVGWPFQETITSLTSNGTTITGTTSTDHNFQAGDSVTITNALPQQYAVSNITSNGSVWTITVNSHPYSVSDSIDIVSVSGDYDGSFSVASVVDANTITVTNAAVHSDSTGTVRLTTPAGWYNGTWTIATAPDVNTFTITDALNTVDAVEGTVGVPNANYRIDYMGRWYRDFTSTNMQLTYAATELATAPLPTLNDLSTSDFSGFSSILKGSSFGRSSLVNDLTSFAQMVTNIDPSNDFPRIKQLFMNMNDQHMLVTFDHPQKLPNTHQMTFRQEMKFVQDLP